MIEIDYIQTILDGKTFTIKSLSKENLNKAIFFAAIEAERIYNNESLRQGRTFAKVMMNTLQGKIAEFIVSQECGLSIATQKNQIDDGINHIWHDLINEEDRTYYEVKAYYYKTYDEYLEKNIKRLREQDPKWNYSKYLIAFECKDDIYTFKEKIKI
jgi:hypothetical protein